MYGSKIAGKRLTFVVSGQLWNGSLVMMDRETKSLWSHILGKCVQGELKGEELPILDSDVTTWKAWLSEYPDTEVLNLRRTSKNYSAEFYNRPERFAYGFTAGGKNFHVTFVTLRQAPVQNLTLEKETLLLTFDPDSTGAHLFSRRLDERVLTFAEDKEGLLRDQQTGSLWSRTKGVAVEGPFQGKQLDHEPAIITFTHKWKLFHPDSTEVKGNTGKP